MVKLIITEDQKKVLKGFLASQKRPELVSAYLYYLEHKFSVQPVVFPRDKTIFLSAEDAVKTLEKEGKLWHETEIKIGYSPENVNEGTKKVYICPFTGKVFGDNTHPNPQDAIYDWVSRCPENTERSGGLRVKRFYVSEDPDVIKNYIPKNRSREPISKVVYSSVLSGKLFDSKAAVVQDFKKNYLKDLTLVEVQNQNRFQIEEHFLAFLQEQLAEDRVAAFVEALAEDEEFLPYIERWVS